MSEKSPEADPASGVPSSESPEPRLRSGRDVGEVLRAAYQSAVDEPIPPEMLDLLSKLR